MGGISDGEPVNQAVTDAAFLFKNADDQDPAKLDFVNTDAASGAFVTNIQRNVNSVFSFVGAAINGVYNLLPTWVTNNRGSSSNTLFQRIGAIDTAFDPSTGHKHTGGAGDAPPITASSIGSVPLEGYGVQGTDLTGVTGGSTNVTGSVGGNPPSSNTSTPGVVVNAPYNKIIIKNSTNDQSYLDSSGNIVYGRLTYSSGTFTLTYYSEITGTETPYSFSGSNGVRWYYQVLASSLGGTAPVYSAIFFIPSDSATADIITATTSAQGKVQLATTAQDVGSADSGGTANATVANADHVHKGVRSVKSDSNAQLFGDVQLVSGTNITLSQAGNAITINSSGGSSFNSEVVVYGANGYGSTNTAIHRFSTTQTNTGSNITYADSATLGASFTINANGIYAIDGDYDSAAAGYTGASVNSSQLTTAIETITVTDRLTVNFVSGANAPSAFSRTRHFSNGDVIRPHGDGSADSVNPNRSFFSIVQVG